MSSEKERKSEADVDGQRQAQRDRVGTIGRIGARLDCLKATGPTHRPLIKVVNILPNKKPISYLYCLHYVLVTLNLDKNEACCACQTIICIVNHYIHLVAL